MIDELYSLLKQKGYKITRQRKAILNTFLHSEKHLLTAAEVHNTLTINKQNVNFSTVYRNLEGLSKIGVLKRINLDSGINSYELNTYNNHHHHLICLKCGYTEVIAFCPMEEINNRIEIVSEFIPLDHRLEIYGHCGNCNKA